MPHILCCPCCKSRDIETLKFEINICTLCGHKFRFSNSEIDYRQKFDRNPNENQLRLKVKSRLEFISPLKNHTSSILDVGCAEGLFCEYIKKTWKLDLCDGVEISKDKAVATNRLNHVYDDLFSIKQSYDLVSAFHMLEHIQDVRRFTERLIKLSKRYIYIEVPLDSGNDKVAFDLHPEHVHYFSDVSLIALLKSMQTCTIKMETGCYESARYNNSIRLLVEKGMKILSLADIIEDVCGKRFIVYGLGGDYQSLVKPIIRIDWHIQFADLYLKDWPDGDLLSMTEIKESDKNILVCSSQFSEEIKKYLAEENVETSRIFKLNDLLE